MAALQQARNRSSIAAGTGIYREPCRGDPASPAIPFWGQSARLAEFNAGRAGLHCGRTYVLPDDMKYLARPVLGTPPNFTGTEQLRGQTPEQVLDEILAQTPLPS